MVLNPFTRTLNEKGCLMSRFEIFRSLIGKKIRIILKNSASVDGVLKDVTEHELIFDHSKTIPLDQVENYFLIDENGKGINKRS